MSPVPRPKGRQYSAKKVAAKNRLERWRSSGLQPDQCVTGRSLVAREQASPGSVYPARPRAHWRRPHLSPTAAAFLDLVQEQCELGAQAVWISHAEHAQLAGKKTRMAQYAVAELLRKGCLQQLPVFEELDESKPMPEWLKRAQRRLQHAEKRPAYQLGPLALVELQREERRRREGAAGTERRLSIETWREAARNSRFSVRNGLRSSPDLVLPEEAPEDPRTVARPADAGCAGEKVSPAATAERLSAGCAGEKVSPTATAERLSQRRRGGPTPDAPPLELRNSWTREAAAPPPRRTSSPARAPAPASPQMPVRAPERPVAAFSGCRQCDGACAGDERRRAVHELLDKLER